MEIKFESSGDFSNTDKWLAKIINGSPVEELRQIAKEGEVTLSKATPVSTGETAANWTSEITTKRGVSEIAWMNRAHPGLSVNIAKILHTGYGTGTGGYVPPRPYITTAMDSVFYNVGNRIARGMIK